MGNTKRDHFARYGEPRPVGYFYSYRGWVYRVIEADTPCGKWYETYGRAASGNDSQTAHAIAEALNSAPVDAVMLKAARKMMAYLKDLGDSNPGFMGNLVLQDYQQWNEAMLELPAAIAKAEGRQ